MKKIMNFIKFTDTGYKFFQGREEIDVDQSRNLNATKTMVVATCPSCGQTQSGEKFTVRTNCVWCPNSVCCSWCHEERVRMEKIQFERQIIIQKERRTWLESNIFENVPMIGLIRKIMGINQIQKLEDMKKGR